MTAKQFITAVAVSAVTAVGSVWGYGQYEQITSYHPQTPSIFKLANFVEDAVTGPTVDFEKAATKAAPAVVHIKVTSKPKQVAQRPNTQANPFDDFFGDMFGERGQPQRLTPQRRGSGSGVSISADGYIVTNNHVIDGADEITVTLENKRDFKAKLVGKDPSTDLAVLKIEAKGLPFLTFANSDNVRLGQWVLAVGYPLGLETTVTSGIVSAKSRSLGINSRQSTTPVESFIQTDAAVNPGNSGGALVNADGDVIGINSAIASPTGSYAGYAYAIPANLVKKVVADIIQYGSAKRAYLGVMFGNEKLSEEERKQNNIKEGDGVFVMDVAKGSAAEQAGVQKGDFITKVNGAPVSTGTEMVEKIASLRPGDKVALTYTRNGAERTGTASLKGDAGTYASVKEQVVEKLGASFENIDRSKAAQLGISSGVVVKGLGTGILAEQTRIREGFIITKVNNQKVNSVDELKASLKNAGNSAIISGVYPQQPQREYQYGVNDLNSIE
ncbi:MAG: serine protease [Segetibacter sp.]|nr:serine protease [Segetibacter sp.]